MAVTIKKFTRLAVYAFFLVLTAFVSAIFGAKRNNDAPSQFSLIPPTAHADVPSPSPSDAPGDGGAPAPAGDCDCDSGSDSGDCCE